MLKRIAFNLFILLLLNPFFAYGGNAYQMMPGKYSLKLSIKDSEESYPVSLSFHVDEVGNVKKGIIKYPTYDCKAVISSSSKHGLTVKIYEKMLLGFDACSESSYKIKLNSKLLFQPHQMKYITVAGDAEAGIISLKVDEYEFLATPYSRFRIKNRLSSYSDIFQSKNSNLLRKHIQLSNNSNSKKEVKNRLSRLTELEKSEYDKIEALTDMQRFTAYMKMYPGSSYISSAEDRVSQIKKNILITKLRREATPESFYKAYMLSKENFDVRHLLQEFNSLNALQGFIFTHENIKEHRLVINDLVKYYRAMASYAGYISAFSLSNSSEDIKKAYMSASSQADKVEVEKLLVRYIGIGSIFNVQVMSKSESEFKGAVQAGLVLSTNASYKDIKRVIRVSSNSDNGLPLQYSEYKVKVKFILDRKFEPKLNDDDRDYITETFILNKSNGFEIEKDIVFKVPIYGKVKAMGMGVLVGLLGSFVEEDISDDDAYIPFRLISTSFSSKIMGVD